MFDKLREVIDAFEDIHLDRKSRLERIEGKLDSINEILTSNQDVGDSEVDNTNETPQERPAPIIEIPGTYMNLAEEKLGLHEVDDEGAVMEIVMWAGLIEVITSPSIPWCAAFVKGILNKCGINTEGTNAQARSFLGWGKEIEEPIFGAIVIFNSHVAFVWEVRDDGTYTILGGNQSDKVNILDSKYFGEALGFRWPEDV